MLVLAGCQLEDGSTNKATPTHTTLTTASESLEAKLKVGMTQIAAKKVFGDHYFESNTSGVEAGENIKGSLTWRFDFGVDAGYTVLNNTGHEGWADNAGLETGKIQMQLLITWNQAGHAEQYILVYHGKDGMHYVTVDMNGTKEIEQNLETDNKETTLAQLYKGDLNDISLIEAVQNSTGKHKSFNDQQFIHSWINNIKDIKLKPKTEQKNSSIPPYDIILFEGNKEVLRYVSGKINGTAYEPESDITKTINVFYMRDMPINLEFADRNRPEVKVLFDYADYLNNKKYDKLEQLIIEQDRSPLPLTNPYFLETEHMEVKTIIDKTDRGEVNSEWYFQRRDFTPYEYHVFYVEIDYKINYPPNRFMANGINYVKYVVVKKNPDSPLEIAEMSMADPDWKNK
jgi:hypothetical protein